LPNRYLLYTGTIEERKNLLGIAKAIHVSGIDIPLVVIGRKTEPYYRKVLEYINSNNLKSIFFPGNVTNGDLPALYQNAECFLYPSFFEGFGIPIVEALVSKTPVITSNTGCFAEAGGPGSMYVDPNDPGMIGAAILRVVQNKDVREKMITTGSAHALKFSEEVIADAYMKLYYSLLQ
jgi:glycosyltransferase involved in cell wall biosynthesis